ncbi:MAG: carboxypeptidase regulatory-like domain-containing protein, partial [Terriglobales bacterium]
MRFPQIAAVSLFVTLVAFPLFAQSPNGTINGLVLDPSNKVIAGADILVINDTTGVKYSAKNNEDGIYVVPNLPPGAYRLQVSKVGFKTLIKPDIVLNIQDALSVNFTLPVGAVFDTVTVEGGASMINTTDASVSTVVDQSYVKNMPLNGRSFQDLILLTPGVVTQTPQLSVTQGGGLGQTGEFSVNGQRTESNVYTVDGVSANVGATTGEMMFGRAGASGSIPAATALGTTQALVSVDDLQEFRVQSSTYSAEYGRNPGGQFSFETKSGTNQWHGTAYDYLRNGTLDAQDWFNDYFRLPEPALRQNDFGGTFGGPVDVPSVYHGKDKTFFFVSYEGLRLTQPQAASINYVPDAALRAGAPAALQQVLNAFPVQSPNGIDDTANGIAQFIGTWSNPSSIDSTSVRFDHVVNDKLRLFFRFSDTTSSSASRGTYATAQTPAMDTTLGYTTRTYTAGANSAFTNRLSNDFRLNYSSNDVSSRISIEAIGGSTPVNLVDLTGLGTASNSGIALLYGGYDLPLDQEMNSAAQRQWNLVDTVSLSLGRHQFKFGLDYRRLAPYSGLASPEADYVYSSKDAVSSNSASGQIAAFLPLYPLYKNLSAFAQDEWRVSQSLSLSFGLRWEVNPPPGVTQGLMPYTVQGTGPDNWAVAPQGTPLWHTTWFNFAPRLGAAYVLHNASGWETVVRGGGGVFFDTGQQAGSLGYYGPGFTAATNFSPASFPSHPAVPVIVNPPVPPYPNFLTIGFATHLQLPYTLQWNISIQQALGKSQALTFSYVGSHGARLLEEDEFFAFTNPNSLAFLFFENGLTSDYDAFQTQFQRRLSRGLTALASYTWSHCIDYGSSNYDLGYQRGNCDFDVRHNLSTALSYDVPNIGHSGVLKEALSHWGFDDRFTARTAFPVTLQGNGLLQPNGQIY